MKAVGKVICDAALIITGSILIANANGEIATCQNASLSGWTESSHIGQSWTACLKLSNYPEQSQSIQRLFIYFHSHYDFFQCSKLGNSWHYNGGNFLNEREYTLSCPSKTNWTMCGTVYNGSKDDMGYLHFASNDQTGETMEICSLLLRLKDWEYPRARLVKSECRDRNNHVITLEMDFVEQEVQFSASLYFNNVLLCNLNRKDKCDMDSMMEQKNPSCHLYCNLSNDATETVTKMYGKNVTGKGIVEYKLENVQRNITVEQMIKIEECTFTGEIPLLTGKTCKMCIWILLLVLPVALIIAVACCIHKTFCKSTEHSKNDISVEEETLNSVSISDNGQNEMTNLNIEMRPLPEQSEQQPGGANELFVDDPCRKLASLPVENVNFTEPETVMELR